MANPLKKLAGQTAIYGGSTIVARLLNYLLVPLHTRIFAPESYGIVGEMYAYVSLLIVLLTYGMETAFFRFYESGNPKRDRVYSTSLMSLVFSTSVFLILILFFARPLADVIRYPHNAEYIIWFALIIAFDAVSAIPFARLRAMNRPRVFAAIKIMNIGINVILNLFFLLLCPYMLRQGILSHLIHMIYNPAIGVGYIFIANLISSGVTLLILMMVLPRTRWVFDSKLWKPMIRYALPLLVFGLAGIINETMDRLLLKYLSPAESASAVVGIYTACYKISIMMTIVIQGFKYAAEPFFFAHARENNARQLYADVMKYFVIVCSVIFLVIMLYIDVVKYFVGEKYYPGLTIVPILLLANMFLGIFYNLSIWYKLTDKTRFGAYLSVGGAIITLILNYLLIPKIGFLGSAWATFFCYLSMMVASYLIGQKHYKVRYNTGRILLYIGLATALVYFSGWLNFPAQWLKYLINTLLLAAYLVVVIAIEKPTLFHKSFLK